MSDDPQQTGQQEGRLSAEGLRRRMSEKEEVVARKAQEVAHQRDEVLKREYEEFMQRPFTDDDIQRVRKRITDAAEQGQHEIEIIRFPAAYLSDHGRRINNTASDWPDSLQGYAKRVYDTYQEIGREEGFRFYARVLDFPGGKVGDVGLTISWKA